MSSLAEKEFDMNRTFTVAIEIPVMEKKPMQYVAQEEQEDGEQKPLPQYMKDNIERMQIIKDGRTYMKNYAKNNVWIIGVRMAMSAIIIAIYLYFFFIKA